MGNRPVSCKRNFAREAVISCIIQVIPQLAAGGAERTTIDMARAITHAGHKAFVISEGGRLEGELAQAGGKLVSLPVASKNLLQIHRNVKLIEAAAQTLNADLIHARSRAPAWSAMIAARNLGLPFVTTYHGTYSEGFPFKRQYNSVMAKGDLVIANSKFVADRVHQLHQTPWERLRIIPRGLDPDWFARIPVAEGTEPVILMPGRLTRWKGQSLMLDAFARIAPTFPAARLVMPGDAQGRNKYRAELETNIRETGLQDRVALPGHIADMRAEYARASVVVSASLEPEAFGRIAIEAQAAGRPILAAGHGGALETVVDGKSGMLFTPGDVHDLADKLAAMLTLSSTRRAHMGAAGRAHVADHFTVKRMCEDTLSVYNELLVPA